MQHRRWIRWIFPVTGLISLTWFLLRVVPKPSRAAYPCQRAAAPLAGGFLVWIAGLLGSALLYRRGKELWGQSRLALACACLLSAVALAIGSLATAPQP